MANSQNKSKSKNKVSNEIWEGVTSKDFEEDINVIEDDMVSYNMNAMSIFIANVNLLRHLPRVADSLKPVERRIIYSLFINGVYKNHKKIKSSKGVGDAMGYHPHSNDSLYGTIVGLAQPWKTPQPLISGYGNFGNDAASDGYSSMRYTDIKMSDYAYENFFSEYDDDCIEKVFNTAADDYEPLVLPSKFPNIVINGGFSIAQGNAYCIPTYNIDDIIDLCKRLLVNPEDPNIYMVPDLPTGCDIVDNGKLREICDTGKGVLKMRSTIEIDGDSKPNVWILKVKNLPWMTSLSSIQQKLVELTKSGVLPIKDTQDFSYPITETRDDGSKFLRMVIDFRIIIGRAHDPHAIIQKLYKMTQLQKSLSIDFKVVVDALSIGKLNMRDILLAWIDMQREYKRRRFNKKISKINARVSLLEVLIRLTTVDNLEKTIRVIRKSTKQNIVENLMKHAKMTSFQAKRIAEMKLNAFTSEAHGAYKQEKEDLEKELKQILSIVKSTKKMDKLISEDLDDLKKYSKPRLSNIVSEESSIPISDTDHFVVITKQGMVKKLPYIKNNCKKTPALGAFKNGDYPVHGLVINNHSSIMLFDSFGKFSTIPVHKIDNCEPSHVGYRIYDYAKLDGEIVAAFEFFNDDTRDYIEKKLNSTIYIATLTKNGYMKKTEITEFTKSRNTRNIRAMKVREDDYLIDAKIIVEKKRKASDIVIFTKKGIYSYINAKEIADQGKDTSGLLSIKVEGGDEAKGFCIVGDSDYLIVITEKGNIKRCEMEFLGVPGKRKVMSYLSSLEENDSIYDVLGAMQNEQLTVCTRTSYNDILVEDIPIKTRKAKAVKMIPVPLGNNIISADCHKRITR